MIGLHSLQIEPAMAKVGLKVGESFAGTTVQLPQHLADLAYDRVRNDDANTMQARSVLEIAPQHIDSYKRYFARHELGQAGIIAELERTTGLQRAMVRAYDRGKFTYPSDKSRSLDDGYFNRMANEQGRFLDLITGHMFSGALWQIDRGWNGGMLNWRRDFWDVEKVVYSLFWHRFILGAVLHASLPILEESDVNPTSIHRGTLLRRLHVGQDGNRPLFVRDLGDAMQWPGQADFGEPGEKFPLGIARRGVAPYNEALSGACRKFDPVVIEVPEAEWQGLLRLKGGESEFDFTIGSTALARLNGVKIWAVRPE